MFAGQLAFVLAAAFAGRLSISMSPNIRRG
jgi:hypothetical protein